MKDLLVYVADADALAFLGSLLSKPLALGIRSISVDIMRHPQRDSGMVQSGAELARLHKGRYRKALLLWDHHGSGRDHRQSPEEVGLEMQSKLDSFTWKDHSAVTALVPELERWLWYSESALATHCGISVDELELWTDRRARKLGKSVDELKALHPKELFEYVMRDCIRRTISPRDFRLLGKHAGVHGLMRCESFRTIAEVLRLWFPP